MDDHDLYKRCEDAKLLPEGAGGEVVATTYVIMEAFRAKHGWGFEVAAVESDGKSCGLGRWHGSLEGAQRQLSRLQKQQQPSASNISLPASGD